MNIIGITMMTNPDYRQDPARECIEQALKIVDHMVVVYGRAEDLQEVLIPLIEKYPRRITAEFLNWPQPTWSLEELPAHLNKGLEIARSLKADWIIKFDTDYFIHERHRNELRKKIEEAQTKGSLLVSLEKIQYYTGTRCLMKGDVPICIKANSKICYGINIDGYTDLCQPIIWDGIRIIKKIWLPYVTPVGTSVPKELILRSGAWMWNYGYTFKTEERAKELLYHFELAHANYWGYGWMYKHIDDVTPDTALDDFIKMIKGRVVRATKNIPLKDHPAAVKEKLNNLKPEQFGFNLWGKIQI